MRNDSLFRKNRVKKARIVREKREFQISMNGQKNGSVAVLIKNNNPIPIRIYRARSLKKRTPYEIKVS